MVWSPGRQVNLLHSTLREFYPAALAAFDDLASGDALAILRIAPEPALGAALSRSQIAAALHRGGDGRLGRCQRGRDHRCVRPIIALAGELERV